MVVDSWSGRRVKATHLPRELKTSAEGAWSSSHVVDMWMRSPGHRRNLLGSSYTEIGIGTAWSDDGTRYDVQVFGRPMASNFLTSK